MANPIKPELKFWRDAQGLAQTNVPKKCVYHSPTGFEWGYGGSGPADLALNILENVLQLQGFKGPRMKCYRNDCFSLSWMLHQSFKWQFISTMPGPGGSIPYQEVVDWIEHRKPLHPVEGKEREESPED